MAEFKLEAADKHVIVTCTAKIVTQTIVQTMQANYTSLYDDWNVVLFLAEATKVKAEAIDELEQWFQHVRNGEHSFVIAALQDDLRHLLPNIEQVPSLTEAQDLIFMEEVERELGVHLDLDEEE